MAALEKTSLSSMQTLVVTLLTPVRGAMLDMDIAVDRS